MYGRIAKLSLRQSKGTVTYSAQGVYDNYDN